MVMSVEDYANELLTEAQTKNVPIPKRYAFIDALNARGTDARTKQFKHYDKIVKWMIANWPELE